MPLEDAAAPNRSLYKSLAYNSPISQYVGAVDLATPVKELQYVKDKADLASGFVKPLQALPHDIEKAKANDKYYKDKLEEISNYNPHDQYRAVRKLAQQYADDSVTGERGHISQSYNNYTNIVKEATDKLDKGEIDQVGYWKMVHQPYSNFKGTNSNNKGGYDVFSGNKVGKYSDINKEASDFAQQWASNKGYTIGSNGNYIRKDTGEYVNGKEVKDAVYNYLASNPKYREQLSHYKEYNKNDGTGGTASLDNLLNGISNPIAERESFLKKDGSMETDPFGLHSFKKKLEEESNNLINTTTTSRLNVEAPELIPEGYVFDGEGKIQAAKKTSMFPQASYSEAKSGIISSSNNSGVVDKWDKDIEHKKINALAYKLGLDVKLTDKQKYEAILKHQEANKERAQTQYKGSPQTQEYLTDLTFRNGNFENQEFKLGQQTFDNATDFAKYLKDNKMIPSDVNDDIPSIKEYIRKNASVSGTIAGMGRYNSKNNAAHSASLNGTEFLISSDEQTGKALQPVNELQKQVFNPKEAGKPVRFVGTDGDANYFTVKFNNGDYTIKLTDSKGKLIPEYENVDFDLQTLGTTSLTNYQKTAYPSAVHSGKTTNEIKLTD